MTFDEIVTGLVIGWFVSGVIGFIIFCLIAWPKSRNEIGFANFLRFLMLGPIGVTIATRGYLHNRAFKKWKDSNEDTP